MKMIVIYTLMSVYGLHKLIFGYNTQTVSANLLMTGKDLSY
ncbi:hypothetical protein [Ornithinibacillus bavariensis]|uniref:Uncharacterized protein n=1 Tax=Ornithinibacillus bavariensis TaxID=545502 RepID=A0A919X6T7_9BACI|nr:hypothetical protein [Ornithinibacillus bavariensis]GIO27002.1 hypothetical protein J43TS3_16130 [Ornithinibacillus bavariensis]